MPLQLFDCRRVEQIGTVFPIDRKLFVVLTYFYRKVVPGHPGIKLDRLDGQPRKLDLLQREILKNEHHLKQRRPVQLTRGLNRRHETFKGHILMRVRVQCSVADAAEQFADGRVSPQLSPQRQSIHEQADQLFQFGARPAGRSRANNDIRLVRVPEHQNFKSGQRRHEGSHAFGHAEFLERIPQWKVLA